MPKISKARIVNFSYNDGKRLIADELYDFAGKEQDKAYNVLINLANGGGKSVLVQLMLQPIIPKAKVAGRRIESFFNKAGEHCFVLLEWIKDNSSEKLLTGIAISAGEAYLSEDDTSRGMSVKYYTFYSNYSSYTSQYDIVNLPLSKKENGRFIPADFDAVRILSRKSNGILNYYVSDDNPKWQKKLAEYGLIQNEWHMMEKLNCEEGGLGKFFGDFKSSDFLVDKLLIPTIEDKLNQSHTSGDNSLSTMLISYVRQYVSQRDELNKKEIYEAFSRELRSFRPFAERLWTADDNLQHSIKDLFSFSDALCKKIDECKILQEKYRTDIERLEKQHYRIEWERASADYYKAEQILISAAEALKIAVDKENTLSQKENDTEHDILVLECADYYQKQVKIKGEIAGIAAEIKQREQGSKAGAELACLKYSVLTQVCRILNEYALDLSKVIEQNTALTEKIRDKNIELEYAVKTRDEAKSEYDRTTGRLDSIKDQTDRLAEKLDMQLFRRLDGFYADDELEEVKSKKQNELSNLYKLQDECVRKQESIENELDAIQQKAADTAQKKQDYLDDKNAACAELDRYTEKENKIKEICAEHNLDFSCCFTERLTEYILSEIDKNSAKCSEVIRKISIAEEEINSAERGSLHVPYTVIEYLNATGVDYTTCEKRLLEWVEEGKITNEHCLEILHNYPALAYGVLLDSANKERFFEYDREKWLPAMIPLFTNEQFAEILNNSLNFDGAIAFYSEEYFADTKHYISSLTEKLKELEQRRNFLKTIEAKLKSQYDFAGAFDYNESWKSEKYDEIHRLEESINNCDKELDELEQRKSVLNDKKSAVIEKINETGQSIEIANHFLRDFFDLTNSIASENALSEELYNKKNCYSDAKRTYLQLSEEFESLKQQSSELEKKQNERENAIEELKRVQAEVGECKETEIISGSWTELRARYKSLEASMNTELSALHKQMEDKQSQNTDYCNEIEKREIEEQEYQNICYSPEQVKKLRKLKKSLSLELEAARKTANSMREQKGKADGNFDLVKQSLSRFGNPLDKSEVGTDFDNRLARVRSERNSLYLNKEKTAKTESEVNSVLERLNDRIKSYDRPESVSVIELDETFKKQFNNIVEQYDDNSKSFQTANKQVIDNLMEMQKQFDGTSCGVSEAISGMLSLLSDKIRGERFYTLAEHIDGHLENSERAISKISTDLREFENSRNDLIHQCTLQGQRIYEGLKQMASSSRVTVYDGKDKKQMIRFDIPNEIDAIVAETSVKAEIDNGTRELALKLSDNTITDAELRKTAEKIVGSKNLLRKYIGKESIKVDAYKIDRNPQNAGYRTWEKTQVNNSGAEKFIVYFAVILSLMNYTRGEFGGIRDKGLSSSLILDNPFGATSSKHILEPMFAIANHFRVQMICLSDIDKSDIVSCFDIVIKAIVKKRPMSDKELLTHEENETIEHGFYRREQISLFD